MPPLRGGLLCSILALAACKSEDAPPVHALEFSRELLGDLSTEHPRWPELCRRSPLRRVGIPNGLGEPKSRVPRAYVEDLRRAVMALPSSMRAIYDEHVCAIVPMVNMPTSGTVVMLAQDRTRGLIIVGLEATDRPANAWVSFKESTPFVATGGVKIVGTLAHEKSDSRQTTLEFVLTHELAHIYDTAFPRNEVVRKIKSLSWPRTDRFDQLAFRHYPAVFEEAELSAATIEPIYEMIGASGFPSPASITSPNEDFADSVATYVHSVVMKRPWQLAVHRGGKVTYRLKSCWGTERCRAKETFLEYLIGDLERTSR